MFLSTHGVNTHKGAIYLSILLLASFTIEILSKEKTTCSHCLLEKISDNIKNLVKESYNISKETSIKNPITHGDYVYKKYKTFGPREEAYNGLPNIINATNYLRAHFSNINNFNNHHNFNIFTEYLYPITLLYIITNTKDTNLIHRGGKDALIYAKNECKKILGSSPSKSDYTKSLDKKIIDKIYALDKKFIDKNLSPGGSADILSMAIFISKISPLYIYIDI